MTITETMETSTRVLHELNKDPENPEDHSRRLLRLVQTRASDSTQVSKEIIDEEHELWAWGGDTSAILIGERNICHWDDDDIVSAVAVSDDRTVVAVGFDTGCTRVYKYSEIEVTADQPHPFGTSKPLPKHHMDSPSFEDKIRDLQFYPGSSNILAVAHEGGLCVLDLSNQDSGPEKFLEDEASKQHKESGIRSIAFSKDNSVMASLAMDGRLCLWNVSANAPRQWKLLFREPERCVTKKDPGTFLGSDAWDQSCRPIFIENNIMALPGETYLQLRKIMGSNVSEHNQISEKGHIDTIVTVTSSGSYLVSTGRDKRVVLWSLIKGKDGALNVKLVHQLAELESAPTCVLWEGDRLFVACADGTLVTISGSMVPNANAKISKQAMKSQGAPHKPAATSAALSKTTEDEELSMETEHSQQQKVTTNSTFVAPTSLGDLSTETETAPKSPLGTASLEINLLNESDDEDESQPSPHQKKQTAPVSSEQRLDSNDSDDEDFKSPVKSRFVDDEASDADDDDGSVQALATNINSPRGQTDNRTESPNQKDDDDSDVVDDDFDNGFDPTTDAIYYGAHAPSHQQIMAQLPPPQPAFAPSSTPLDLARRFMCWNHIGSIRRGDLGGRFSVQVDFTDSGFRRPISFTDNSGYILASLGEDGGLFATDVANDDDDDDGVGVDLDDDVLGLSDRTKQALKRSQRKNDLTKATGSTLYFLRFETFGNIREKDWFLTLPSGERALGCATGQGWAAVMTNRRFLRLFSSGGNQSQVFWLQGEPITMAGRSCFLAVFFHEGEPLRDGTQKIGYMLIDCSKNRIIAKGSATCISSRSKLLWVGFDKDFSLVAMDSAGMVSMLVCTDGGKSWEWIPVLDTLGLSKSTDDSFWPVTVYDGKLVCIPLKGGLNYPDASKRPVTTTLDFKLPLARGTLVKGNALEELSIRASIALGQKKVMRDILNDGQEAEEFENEFAALSAKVDKVTLRLFATIVDAGKLERALDLVDRLYHERSYEIAMDLADNHRTLVDLIEDRKESKFGGQFEEVDDYDESPEVSASAIGQRRISPDSTVARMSSKRQFDDDEANRHVRPKQSFAR